jgi:dTDP-4-dehydrorhamnose reductase
VRVLVLGGDGMLGHQLLSGLRDQHHIRVTLHQPLAAYGGFDLFSPANTIDGVDARDPERLAAVIASVAPQAVINCIGIVKQRRDAKSPIPSLEINALLPHRLLAMCRAAGARLIHFSTDCVFSGRKGDYRESDTPDPVDLYGRTKLLGEVEDAPGLTLRTSIIGPELTRKTGLIEWFLAQRGAVRGFTRAIYTGVTTLEMSRLVSRILAHHPDMHGVWHVASAPISKYDLLVDLSKKLGRSDVQIAPDDGFACDRSLNADRFTAATGYRAPAWDEMLTELADVIQRSAAVRRAVR